MIKSLTASLFVAASFAQVPPGLATTTTTVPATTIPIVPEVPAIPAVPATTTTTAVPATTAPVTTAPVTTVPGTTAPATTTTTTAAPVTTVPATTVPATTVPATTTTTTAVPVVPTNPTTTTTAVPLLPPGDFWGSYGQICSPDPLRDAVCQTAGQIASDQVPGFMKCERGYDCCLCGSVSCGSEYRGCNTFSAGDSGIKGVKDVKIYGRLPQNGGAEVLCLGVEACADSKIAASNVKQIKASGIMGLRNAVVTVANPVEDFQLDCSELGACEGLKLEIVIEGPPPGYQCNPALDPITIEFNAIQCSKEESCSNMDLTIRNDGCNTIEIQSIECIMPTSCAGASFNFIGDVQINNCEIRGAPPSGLGACYQGGQGNNPWGPGSNPGYNPYWVPL